MLQPAAFLGRTLQNIGQEFGVQQRAADHFTAAFIIGDIHRARQHQVGGGDIDTAPAPAHQRNFVERGCQPWLMRKIQPQARAALDPQMPVLAVAVINVIGMVIPVEQGQRVLPSLVAGLAKRAFGIHIDQHRGQGAQMRLVEPFGQRAQAPRCVMRIDQKLVAIDRQAPIVMAKAGQQMVQPVHPEMRRAVAGIGIPDRGIFLCFQKGGAAIG